MSRRSIVLKGLGALVLAAVALALVLVGRPSAAPGARPENTPAAVVVKAQPDGAVVCNDVSSEARHEGALLYYWSEGGLQTMRCQPVRAGGVIGLGG